MNKGRTKDAALRRLTRGVINRASRLPQPIDYEAVLDLDELDKLFEYLASIDLAQFGVTDGGKPVPASKPHLLRFYIAPALAIMQSNGVRFDEVYGELEDSFYVDSSTWINLAPLMNFKATSAPVNVTEGTNIRRLTTTEVHNISRYWPGPWGPTEPPKFGVEVTVSRPKAAPYGDSEATTRLEETLAALRLVKPGSVAYGQMARGEEMVYIQWIVGPSFGTLAMGNPGFQTGMAGYSNPPLNRYVLYKDDIPRLREIASNIGTAQAVQSLKNAIVRLGLALQRFKPEDALSTIGSA